MTTQKETKTQRDKRAALTLGHRAVNACLAISKHIDEQEARLGKLLEERYKEGHGICDHQACAHYRGILWGRGAELRAIRQIIAKEAV